MRIGKTYIYAYWFLNMLAVCAVTFCVEEVKAQANDNYLSKLSDKNVTIPQTNLPIIFINVDGHRIDRNRYILGRMKIIHNGDGQLNYGDTVAHPDQKVDYEGFIAIKWRGHSSFDHADKKPFSIRTLEQDLLPDQGGEKKKVQLAGMNKDSKWCTIAPWADRSMLRDALSYELARPWMDFTPSTRFCELILDGHYFGIYLLAERISKGKYRLNLNNPGEDEGDLTGDYHVEVNRSDQPSYVSTYHPINNLTGSPINNISVYYNYEDPADDEFKDLPEGTREALNNEIYQMERAFYRTNYTNPETGYRQYVDVTSFIDYLLSTEVSMNVDGYRLSTNYYKYSRTRAEREGLDSRWKMAIWDFNIAWGNANYNQGDRTDLWVYEGNGRNPSSGGVPFYWYRLTRDESFMDEVSERWLAYRSGSYHMRNLFHTIDSLAEVLTSGGAVSRNQQAWRIIGRQGVWPCPFTTNSYEEEIQHLKAWIQARIRFMDRALLPRQLAQGRPLAVLSGFNADVVAEQSPVDQSFDTALDGSRVFYAEDLQAAGALPASGIVISNGGVCYQLAPFNGLNAVKLNSGEETEILFDGQVEADTLYLLGTATYGPVQLEVTANYDSGESSTGQCTIADWSQRNPDGSEAWWGLGCVSANTTPSSSVDSYHYTLFEQCLQLRSGQKLKSLTVYNVSQGSAALLAFTAVGGLVDGIGDVRPDMAQHNGSSEIYDLFGRRQSRNRNLPAGIYVVNGRKVLIR